MKIIKWKVIEREISLQAHIFRYVKVKSESPSNGKVGNFDIVQCLNWVNIIAITKDQKIVLIKQYRHGTEVVTVEIPGGAVNIGEDPRMGAERELKEETGYTSNKWLHLGRVAANPAFMNNFCDTYLALDAELTHAQDFDPFEEIEVYLKDKKDISSMVRSGEINHSLVIAALYLLETATLD
jgi:ADP-ribose pyrophosphatase